MGHNLCWDPKRCMLTTQKTVYAETIAGGRYLQVPKVLAKYNGWVAAAEQRELRTALPVDSYHSAMFFWKPSRTDSEAPVQLAEMYMAYAAKRLVCVHQLQAGCLPGTQRRPFSVFFLMGRQAHYHPPDASQRRSLLGREKGTSAKRGCVVHG